MAKGWKTWGTLFVTGVLVLITFIPVTTQLFIFLPWLAYHRERNPYIWLGPFNILVLSIWVNYFLGVFTDPGKVPVGYDPRKDRVAVKKGDESDSLVWSLDVEATLFTGPWLNTCVGHGNQGHFLRFITSVTLASLNCMTLIAFRIRDVHRYQSQFSDPSAFISSVSHFYTPLPDTPEVIAMILNLVLLFFLLLSVGILTLWQFYYSAKGITTIESFENSRIEELVRRKKIEGGEGLVYPYDLGLWGNLKAVLGRRVWLWWVPQRAEGDGIHFEISEEARRRARENGGSVDWPPKAYYVYKRESSYGGVEDGKGKRGSGRTTVAGPRQEEGDDAPTRVFGRNHVRRGSEGYVVKEWTAEERDEMVRIARARAEGGITSPIEHAQPPNGSLLRPKPLIELNLPPPDLSRRDREEEEEENEEASGAEFGSEDESSDDEWSEESDADNDHDDDDVPLVAAGSQGVRQRLPNEYVDDGGVVTSCSGDVQQVDL
ncbi:Palmitoyltransferase [Rhizophlyctis rosea]|uniref:Palmitoyltransferase n=1 Tax=Rhizophlyctis rosea TaxID=64517 RepID=A0AAD5SJG1_9FUNG|nr:Palmitoyltransferase [Rhizophlyctis rosea]